MTIASKHFDPCLGIDIHMYVFPPVPAPLPLPTPHIGIVLDPFDYIPFIGSTVHVDGSMRGAAGTGGMCVHIPLGPWVPPVRMPMGPQFMDDEVFMGSRTVSADGEPFSRLGEPVLDCSFLGMVAPIRLKPKKKIPMSLVLPTAVNLSLPTNVIVGGPSTVNLMALAFRAGFAGLGALRKTDFYKAKMDAFQAWRRTKFREMPPGFLKCKVLRAEPVDIRDGSVVVEHEDFSVPGRLPLAWTRRYSARGTGVTGSCGSGWQTPADIRLEVAADGAVWLHAPGRLALFPGLPEGSGDEVLELTDGARLYRARGAHGNELQVRTRDGLRYAFAAPGEEPAWQGTLAIERIEDSCSNHWRFERRDGHLVRIVESGVDGLQGRLIEVESRHGRIERMQLHDPATSLRHPLVEYRYSAEGDLASAIDPLGAARTFAYEGHRMVRHTDRVGLSFHYAYDAEWRVIHAWGDGGLYDYRFAYDELLRECAVTDSLGNTSIVKFDEANLPLCEIDPLDGVTVFEYDDFGRTTAVVDPMGLRTEWQYDEHGNEVKSVQPDGSVVVREFDDNDQLVSVTDAGGHVWAQSTDARGLLQAWVDPLGAQTRYEHDRHGQLVRQVNARGATTTIAYDRHGQLAALTDPLGHVTRFRHDPLGRLLEQGDPLDQTSCYHYDAKGRLLRIVQPDGEEVRCEYDAEDQLLRYVDEAGAQTQLQYVGVGQVGKRIQPDGCCVEYHYDTEEQLVALINQRGERYELRRDALGRIVEEVDYWGQSRQYRYDAAGRLTATTDPLGQRVAFQTDRLGRIVRKTLADVAHPGQELHESFGYDKRGLLVDMRNRNRHVKRGFDAAGRLVEELQDGFRVGYGYDEVGNRTLRETSAGHHVACGFDLRDQVASVTIDDEAPITLTRDALGRTTHEQLSAHVQRQFEYSEDSLLTAQTVLKDAGPLFDTRYDYDRAGNLTSRTDSQQGRDVYSYDVLGRLLQHTNPAGKIERFLNDPAGDRLQTRVREVKLRKIAGGEDEPQVQWTREGTYEGVHYVFDRAGDLVRKGSPNGPEPGDLELVWDANHRLAESRRDGQRTTYGYDPLGRRVFKRNPTHTTWFYWDGDALLGEVQQANDDPEAAPVWIGNVANLVETKRRQQRLAQMHRNVREYVYYPGSFVPLAMIDPMLMKPSCAAVSTAAVAAIVEKYPARKALPDRRLHSPRSRLCQPLGEKTAAPNGGSRLGAMKLGEHLLQVSAESSNAELMVGHEGAGRLGGIRLGSSGSNLPEPNSALVKDEVGVLLVQEGAPASRSESIRPEITGSQLSLESKARAESEPELGSVIYHYHLDPNGCPTRMTDLSGQIFWSAIYSAWGRVSEQEAWIQNPIRYQGQYFDQETGLHYNRYRYFDPVVGQYISRDPLGLFAGDNLYRYAPNSLAFIDPLGLIDLNHKGAGDRGYTIYALIDSRTGVVKYVGMTEDARFWDRMNEHQQSGRLHGALESIELDSAETFAEARGKEQYYIDRNKEIVMQTDKRGAPLGPGAEGNRQVGFDINRQDARGLRYRSFYDRAIKELGACRG